MARQRDPKRDEAFEIWKQHNGEITNRAIAEQLRIDEKKVAVWKQRDKWNVVQQKQGTQETEKKARAPSSDKGKRSGNHNLKNQFSKRNRVAEKHGLFSRFLPEETKKIIDAMTDLSAANLIWLQIEIQFAAIIRSQKIMWVEDKDEMIKEIKKTETYSDDNSTSEKQEWEFQFAWERQATFLHAQSRAMAELRSLIKQFDELAHVHDERRLKLEQMRLTDNR